MNCGFTDVLSEIPLYRRLSKEDGRLLAEVSTTRSYGKGEVIFDEGRPSEVIFTVVSGRVKVVKTTPAGKTLILEIFGPGDPLGAVAVYERRPYPATAVALEPTTCLLIPKESFFALLESSPSFVRGLLSALAWRLVELTNRLTERTGGRIEPRLARLFLKLGRELGRSEAGGIVIPLPLSRQELADLTGTTIETCIRTMSRWRKDGVVRTEKTGFVVLDSEELERIAAD